MYKGQGLHAAEFSSALIITAGGEERLFGHDMMNISFMKQPTNRARKEGSAVVTLHEQGLIICRLIGFVDGPTIKDSMRQTQVFVEKARAEMSQPCLLIDISQVTGQDSAARMQAKGLKMLDLERVAVSGGKRPIVMVGRYIARAAGMGKYTRFFRTESQAKKWLLHDEKVASRNGELAHQAVALLIVGLLAVATLVGWYFDNDFLKSIIPGYKPMNPVTATLLLILVAGVFLVVKAREHWASRFVLLRFVACLCLVYGVGVLSRFFITDLHVDDWLFSADMLHERSLGRVAPGIGLGFICLGVMLLCFTSSLRFLWQRYLFHAIALVIIAGSLVSIIGYGFGFERYDVFDNLLSGPLNTALAFLLLNLVLTGLAPSVRWSAQLYKKLHAYWQAVAVLIILLFATGIIWQQVIESNNKTIAQNYHETFTKAEAAVTSRLRTYTDMLDGYRGLFAASTDVSPDEFHRYFEESGLSRNYPGFSAFTYIPAVRQNDVQTFTKRTRGRASIEYPAYSSFSIFPANNNAVHYPILYVEPVESTTRYGFDLSTEAVRRTTLEQARDSGEPVASGLIDLSASRPGLPPRYGFFICLPIYRTVLPTTTEQRRAQHGGFVIAYFQNDELFTDLFKDLESEDVRFTIRDISSGQQLYQSAAVSVQKSGGGAEENETLTLGGQQWSLNMVVAASYGKTKFNNILNGLVLMGGLVVTLLASLVVLGQLRRRDQALQLAGDMTKDLNTERNLAITNEQKEKAILNSIGDAVFAIDNHERITLFNPSAQKVSGFSEEEALGKHYAEILPFKYEKDKKANTLFVRQALQGHVTSMKNHTLLVRRDGTIVSVADSAAPIRDAKGTILGAIIVFRDVTKEYALDQAKSEFVSLASHQLRTPLSAVNWYSEMLLDGDAGKLNDEQRLYMQEIFEGNQRMIELVDSLLNVSRLEVGKLKNDPKPTSISVLIESLHKELQTSISGKQLSFTAAIPSTLPLVVADPKLLRMILQNLLSNAVKYTPTNGKVYLTVRSATKADVAAAKLRPGKEYLFLSVKDSGYGIPKIEQEKIFEKLYRAENVRKLDVEGTGLGLYIVKKVCNKLGGEVWFESMESVGTTFYVVIPFQTKPS